MIQPTAVARNLNRNCLCKTFDREFLLNHLEGRTEIKSLLLERPNLFSNTTIYISFDEFNELKSIIQSIENVIRAPAFQELILNKASKTALHDFGPQGVFMGYDFHLTEDGPRLIEINTNAGGAYLNLLLAKAQMSCCDGTSSPVNLDVLEDKFFDMFMNEWRTQRGDQELRVVVIMDENPEKQYLYPEFKLFADLFSRKGVMAFVLDPTSIEHREDGLWYQDQKIDMIYNRATDFYFDEGQYAGVKDAYLEGKVVITPNPNHHALYAYKENLELLTDAEKLKELGIDSSIQEILLKGIPATFKITDENRSDLWNRRKDYFFKPSSGFGSKATYRGDKLTTKVWCEMTNSTYVAQKLTPPDLRLVENDGKQLELKQDLRVYTYNGEVLLLASRLYMGQTTNFRTEGGGFAPVFVI